MNKYRIALLTCFLLALCAFPAMAQGQKLSPEEEAKQLREGIDREIDRLTTLLDLEDWQVFYVDSTLTYNYEALIAGRNTLQQAKVSNPDLYYLNADKWNEATYVQFQKIFTERQWQKYLRGGAGKEKKARDKRAEKIVAATNKQK